MKLIKQIFPLLFSLGFSLGGLILILETAWPMWQDWQAMQNWQAAQAEIIELKAFDNQTIAKYRYQINGEPYSSERVYVASFNDNIGDYQQVLQARLKQFKQESLAIDIWVNPDNYHQAVIDRKMRWGLFILIGCFCGIFILIGLSMFYAFVRSSNKATSKYLTTNQLKQEWDKKLDEPDFEMSFFEYRRERLAQLQQDQEHEQTREKIPENKKQWRNRKGWESSKINSMANASLYTLFGLSVFLSLVSIPLLFKIQDELNQANEQIWWVLIIPFAALFTFYKAIVLALQFRRFGKIVYEMDPYPGAIGGQVGGRIIIPLLAIKQDQQVANPQLKLECVFSSNSGGADDNRHTDIKWAQTGYPKLVQYEKGSCFIFNYDIPKDLVESSVEAKGSYYFWRLILKFEFESVELERIFIIPVFKSKKVSRMVSHNISEQIIEKKLVQSEQTKSAICQGDFKLAGMSKSMSYEDIGHSLFLYFPMFRNLIFAVFMSFFTVPLALFSYFIVSTAFDLGNWGIIFGIVSVPFVFVSLLTGIGSIYLPLANLKTIINSEKIRVMKRWFIIPVYIGSMKLVEVKNIYIRNTASKGSGVEKIEFFKIEIAQQFGKSLTIAEDIEGKEVAMLFAEYICKRFDIKTEVSFVKKLSQLKKLKQKNS